MFFREAGRAWDAVVGASRYITGGFLVISVLLITTGVVARYFFAHSLSWVDEYGGYLLVLFTFMGLAAAQKQEAHIKVDILTSHLSRKVNTWLQIIILIAGIYFIVVFTYQTWRMFYDSYRLHAAGSNVATKTPLALIQWVMPLGLGLMSVVMVSQFVARISSLVKAGRSSTRVGQEPT